MIHSKALLSVLAPHFRPHLLKRKILEKTQPVDKKFSDIQNGAAREANPKMVRLLKKAGHGDNGSAGK